MDPNERTQITSITGVAPAEDPGEVARPFIVLMVSERDERAVPLGDSAMVIGRADGCGLLIDDLRISRQHAKVERRGDEIWLEDMGSTNGTFVAGRRLEGPHRLRHGHSFQVGANMLRFEWRRESDIAAAQALAQDLERAAQYVISLLPRPITEGALRVDWVYEPSAKLGGDVFGYHALDGDTATAYLIDVSGHGVGAAMHSTSIMSALRRQALPGVDFRDPGQVLTRLNDTFLMDDHDGFCFTMWYGVYHVPSRVLTYGSGGHHPGYLVSADRRRMAQLRVDNPLMGAVPGYAYGSAHVEVPHGATLYLFSDGVFDLTDRTGRQWRLGDFVRLLSGPPGREAESRRLFAAVREAAAPGPLQDDCSLMTIAFD